MDVRSDLNPGGGHFSCVVFSSVDGRRILIASVLSVSAVAILVTTIVGFAGQFQNAQKDVPIAAVWLSTSVLTDTFITIFLTLHLVGVFIDHPNIIFAQLYII